MTQTKGRWAFDIEEWKPVINFEDRYEVSSFGLIRSIPFLKNSRNNHGEYSFMEKGGILKPSKTKDNYFFVSLCRDKYEKRVRVHRLVAEHFLLNPDNLPQINHIDGNKQNNHISNLEWCSAQHNVIHSYKLGLASNKEERHPSTVLTHEKVFRMAEMRYGGYSYKQISEELDLKYATVWSVINRRNWAESYTKAMEMLKNAE